MAGAGGKELRQLRLRSEATNGAGGSPRFLWRGPVEGVEDTRVVTFVEEQVGIYGGADRTYTAKLGASLALAETEATFEQLPDLFQMAGFGTNGGNWAGSAQGVNGSTAIFTLLVPAGTRFPNVSYMAEAGDDAWAETTTYLVADEVKLSFKGGEAMKVSASLIGRNGTATNAMGSFTNVGTLVPVEEILSGMGTFYLTPAGSGWGTGQVTAGNILEGEITFKPKWAFKFSVDAGRLDFATAIFTGIDIEGQLTLEHQVSGTYGVAGSAGQLEKWRAELPQLLECSWPGGAITAGTTNLNKLLDIKLPIKWEMFEKLSDMDGNDVRVGKFKSKWAEDTSAASRGTVTIVRRGTSEFAGA